MREKTSRTYYYTGSWRNDVAFNAQKVTEDKPRKFSQTIRAKTRREASSKLLRKYP